MIINKHNCEAFFLDYHEGRLSPVEQSKMLLFLEENPELKELFYEYEAACLHASSISFPGKSIMKKKYNAKGIDSLLSSEITQDNCDQFFIGFIEKCLSDDGISKLNLFLANNPRQKKEFELFKQTRLCGEQIYFEEKARLKKSFVTTENRETFLIRFAEKDLNSAEEEYLRIFLQQNPAFKKEIELFTKTLLPVEQIMFPDKESLKKKKPKPIFISTFNKHRTHYAAAAVILVLVGLFFVFRNNAPNEQLLPKEKKIANKTKSISYSEGRTLTQLNAPSVAEEKHTEIYGKNQQSETNYLYNSLTISPKQNTEKKKSKRQLVITEHNEDILVEKEQESSKMNEPEIIEEKKQEEKQEEKQEDDLNISLPTLANAPQANPDEYETLGSLVKKQIKKVFRIQKANSCISKNELDVWDVVMVVKNKLQDFIGTKAIDVNRFCEGNGEKVEYVLSAGQFEISRKTKNKNRHSTNQYSPYN